jgi:chorismate mutase/prephenate dehydratase
MTSDEPDLPQPIARLRAELETADRDLIVALAQRSRVVDTIAALKAETDAALRDPALDPDFVARLFRDIIEHSVRTQEARIAQPDSADAAQTIAVGYQGAEGAYAHQAARRYFSPWHARTMYRAFPTFRDMLHGVRTREIEYAVLPIENTTAGSVTEAYDLLASMDLAIVGEQIQPIDHCLIGVGDVPLRQITRVYSHPQALAQCSEFLLRMPWCDIEEFSNTALAVRKVADDGNPAHAAIASEEAARLAGLPVLARDIANQRDNFTRFVIIADRAADPPPGTPCKTSVLFVTRHERGALVKCLNELADRGLNLTKIESRPRAGAPWEYQFYVDFEGSTADPRVEDALRALASTAFFLKVFGSYPARTTPNGQVGR